MCEPVRRCHNSRQHSVSARRKQDTLSGNQTHSKEIGEPLLLKGAQSVIEVGDVKMKSQIHQGH